MGNQHSHEKPKGKGSGGLLTSAQQLQEWLPDSVKKIEQGALPAHRDVQDWGDENVVEKATQVAIVGSASLAPACCQRARRRQALVL
jgi:hypothetical protein